MLVCLFLFCYLLTRYYLCPRTPIYIQFGIGIKMNAIYFGSFRGPLILTVVSNIFLFQERKFRLKVSQQST